VLPISGFVTLLAVKAVSALLAAYRNTLILGSAIFGFSCVGAGLIVGSALTTGWWQAFQLAIGVSLLVVGTVELGILGLLHRVLKGDKTGPQITINRGDASVTLRASELSASQVAAFIAALDERPQLRQNPEAFGKFS
jgi:hypothetical protein